MSDASGKRRRVRKWLVHSLESSSVAKITKSVTWVTLLFGTVWVSWFLMWRRHAEGASDFSTFMSIHGATLGCLFAIVSAVLIVFVPSRLESELATMAEGLRSPLDSFDEVYRRAKDLLSSLSDEQSSVFRMISATPVLGLEYGATENQEWIALMESRITTQKQTEIICLHGDGQAIEQFCSNLAVHLGLKDKRLEFLDNARDYIGRFKQAAESKTFRLRECDSSPAQIVIASSGNPKKPKTGLVFYATAESLQPNRRVTGFVTTDPRMIQLLEYVFEHFTTISAAATRDTRTSIQRQRDNELARLSREQPDELAVELPYLPKGYNLVVKNGVFPPDIEIAHDALVRGIQRTIKDVWTGIETKNRIGLDVGTGSGALALLLAGECDLVYASDIFRNAIENARLNFSRYKQLPGCDHKVIEAFECDLLESIPKPKLGAVPIIVFNHPLYPSIHNHFHVGGTQAGSDLIARFLIAVRAYIEPHGVVLMPQCKIAIEHNVVHIAQAHGFRTLLIAKSGHDTYGDSEVWRIQV